MAGVLCLIALVVAAAANPTAAPLGCVGAREPGIGGGDEEEEEEEEARKWLAAMVVRCRKSMGFEMELGSPRTLKQMIGVQRVMRWQLNEE
ncbi:hypothetical protein LTR36_005302 [Oleoguttula mirabilis]|uniref:Secreted protein n=1 Tax=Oleoguttula mirabilis TaxID=1507867 RepID=A0AAV9JF66_9PEZI|nr:hypothetical protein LTR36_005302 [Oleoguttula mirabilis]